MERIRDRLLKIKRLAESGETHEAANARMHLEAMLAKYGMTIADLSEDERTQRVFEYGSMDELTLLALVCCGIVGEKRTTEAKYKPKARQFFIDLTAYEYAELRSMFDWHRTNFRKEKRKLMKTFCDAYIIKHNLCTSNEDAAPRELTADERRQVVEAIRLSDSLSDVYYRKQIGG